MAKKSSKNTTNTKGVSLISQFREVLGKDGLGKESTWEPTFRTGFDVFDYRNGKIEDDEISIGIEGGKILYIIGKPGTGKTSWVIQLACNIADQYENSQVLHFDVERATGRTRVRQITGWSLEKFNQNYIHMEEGLTTESFYKTIKAIANIKKQNFEELKISSGKYDHNGNEIFYLPPTVFILDSLAVLTPENIESEEELSGNMSATAIARANTAVFKRIMSSIKSANIILIVINHINQKVEVNPMVKT